MALDLEIVPATKPPPPSGLLRKVRTLRDTWDMFLKMRGDLAPSTIVSFNGSGLPFCAFMEGRQLGPTAMLEWMQHLQAGGVKKTQRINAINMQVRAFLRWLKVMNLVQMDLDKCLPPLRVSEPAKESKIITEEEYERIVAYCSTKGHFQTHLWLITLAYRTGMSLVDCCYLRWQNVHINENAHSYIDIHRIKTKRLGPKALCRIPLLPFSDLWTWLEKLKTQEPYKRFDGITDYVHRDGPGLYECRFSAVQQDFKNIFKLSKVEEGKSFRNLRNSFCSMLVNSNTNLALVCSMTGHNSVGMLLRYLKPDRRALQDALFRAVSLVEQEKRTV